MRHFVFYSFICLLGLAALIASTPAQAQPNVLPQTYVPWLETQGYVPKGHSYDNDQPQRTNQRHQFASERDRRRHLMQDGHAQNVQYDQLQDRINTLSPTEMKALARQLNKLEPSAPPPSKLEDYYSQRIVDELHQFGYDLFEQEITRLAPATPDSPIHSPQATGGNTADRHNGAAAAQDSPRYSVPSGTVQDDFILGAGDRLTVIFRGQRQTSGQYVIHGNGQLIIEDLPPITAAGRPLGNVHEQLQNLVSRYYNTDVFVSLDAVRQIDVLVMGHVENPGRKTMTVFHTVIDALMDAGGIDKTGSLRQIKLVRNGRSTVIDLYSLFMHGSTHMDLNLRDGDRLIVPPIGPTFAISGAVKRPGIYEIKPVVHGVAHTKTDASPALPLDDVLTMAGGLLNPGENRFMQFALSTDGTEHVREISNHYDPIFGDGSILRVTPSTELRKGTVELTGHTRKPGLYDLSKTKSLAALINSESVFGGDIYPLIGVIERWDNDVMAAKYIDFPPLQILQDKFDRKLEDGDIVHLFSRTQILNLQKPRKEIEKDYARTPVELGSMEPAAGKQLYIDEMNRPLYDESDNQDYIHNDVLVDFLRERTAFIRGAVRRGGAFPVAAGLSLEQLIAVAGGMTLEASVNNIELTSAQSGEGDQTGGKSGTRRTTVNFAQTDPADVILTAGDSVHIKQKFKKITENAVEIVGEVRNPGRYDLMPGDKLSDLLERAGGLTNEAYADGTIFSRESSRRAEESRFKAAARELQRALATATDPHNEDPPSPTQMTMMQQLIAELKNIRAVGRITVEADPAVLDVQPELDILLETGDRIYVPRRPLTVRVSGEVLSPAELQFRDDKDAADYVAEAGGYSFDADKNRTFVLYPDGSAEPLAIGSWNHNKVFIPPGSTIVVPADPQPMTFMQTARDFSQILSNLAITGIFLDDLED